MPKVEVEVSSEQLKKLCNKPESEIKIAILQRGWVFVGRFSKKGSDCQIQDGFCIRNWGTSKGLGELCSGPTSKTVLDPVGIVRVNELGIVALLDCEGEKWNRHF